MARLRYNGLTATLGAAMDATQTSITFAAALTSAAGAVPTIGGSDYIPLTILDSAGAVSEIVSLTAYTSGATTGTVTRAQESTTGVAHASGDAVVHSATVLDFNSTPGVATTRDVCTSNTAISTTTLTDITGVTRSVTVGSTSDAYLVIVSLDVEMTATSSAYFTAKLNVDGTDQTSEVVFRLGGLNQRSPAAQTWLVTGLAAGARTFKMRAALTAASGTYNVSANHSSMVIMKVA